MSEEFAAYWDADVPLVESTLDYHQVQALNFRDSIEELAGEEPYFFNAQVDGETYKGSLDEFVNLEAGRVDAWRSEHLTDNSMAEIEYNSGNGSLFDPDYRLTFYGSKQNRDVFNTYFEKNLRRQGFRKIIDLLE